MSRILIRFPKPAWCMMLIRFCLTVFFALMLGLESQAAIVVIYNTGSSSSKTILKPEFEGWNTDSGYDDFLSYLKPTAFLYSGMDSGPTHFSINSSGLGIGSDDTVDSAYTVDATEVVRFDEPIFSSLSDANYEFVGFLSFTARSLEQAPENLQLLVSNQVVTSNSKALLTSDQFIFQLDKNIKNFSVSASTKSFQITEVVAEFRPAGVPEPSSIAVLTVIGCLALRKRMIPKRRRSKGDQ